MLGENHVQSISIGHFTMELPFNQQAHNCSAEVATGTFACGETSVAKE